MEVSGLLTAFAVPAAVVLAAAAFITYSLKLLRPQESSPPAALLNEFAQDDKKAKRRKTKDKKEPEPKPKKAAEPEKKSPAKEKPKQEKKAKAERQSPPEPKEKKAAKEKKEPSKPKTKEPVEKPADFDDGDWEKVPTKNDKKSKKKDDDKRESPKADKKRGKDAKEPKKSAPAEPEPYSPPKQQQAHISKELQDQILQLQRALHEAEQRDRDRSQTPIKLNETPAGSAPATPEVKSRKKVTAEVDCPPPQKEKKPKKQASDEAVKTEEDPDDWTDAKVQKKGKKKPRKE